MAIDQVVGRAGPRGRRRAELGAFLRSRRERTDPAEAGLPPSGRRRTPGLRREELALLAGISTTWYTYLEQGRDIRPSDQVLSALANTLRLDAAERRHLFALAGTGAAPVGSSEGLAPNVAAVPLLLHPNPAYITSAGYDLLAWNRAAAELFGLLLATGPDPADGSRPNLARWVFTDPAAREVLVDWADVAEDLLARLRTTVGRNPGDRVLTGLVEELTAASPEARAWWPRYDIRTSHGGAKRLRHPRRGPITLTYASFTVADSPGQTLVVFYDEPGPGEQPAR